MYPELAGTPRRELRRSFRATVYFNFCESFFSSKVSRSPPLSTTDYAIAAARALAVFDLKRDFTTYTVEILG
jgi:hypothetical protein